MIKPPLDADVVFVREYLKLEGRDDAAAVTAYRRAGYFEPAYPIAVAAERVLTRADIQTQIEAGRAKLSKTFGGDRSLESWLADVDEVFESALAEKDHAAAVNAKRAQAQVLGYMQESVTVTHKMDVSMMTDEQLLRIINSKPVVDGVFKEVPARKGIGHMKPPDDGKEDSQSGRSG